MLPPVWLDLAKFTISATSHSLWPIIISAILVFGKFLNQHSQIGYAVGQICILVIG